MSSLEMQTNPHMWRPNNGPEPFEEICDLCGVFRYAVHGQRSEPTAAALPCPEPWPQSNMTTEDIAALEAQAEKEDRAEGKSALYDSAREPWPDARLTPEEFADYQAGVLDKLPPPYCGYDAPPPPLPELTEDEKRLSMYDVPFLEAFGKDRIEILLKCRECGQLNNYGMWEWCGRLCFDCGSNKGATK